ncbi:hypothetical protein LPA07_19170 [Lactiplantibacillus paraplantarum]|nr:hypothetical protein LPA07_19170 [Lactiplantibacillus paraplantarum]
MGGDGYFGKHLDKVKTSLLRHLSARLVFINASYLVVFLDKRVASNKPARAKINVK